MQFYIAGDNGGTPIEVARIRNKPNPCQFEMFEVHPLLADANVSNVYDIHFKLPLDSDADDKLEIRFPTHNGVRQLYDIKLGIPTINWRETSYSIDCMFGIDDYSFSKTTANGLSCEMTFASSQAVGNDVIVIVSGMGALTASTKYILTLGGIRNPAYRTPAILTNYWLHV